MTSLKMSGEHTGRIRIFTERNQNRKTGENVSLSS